MKTLVEMWDQYCRNALPRDYPDVVKTEVKLAFYAAIFALLADMKSLVDRDNDDEVAFHQLSGLLADAGRLMIDTLKSRGRVSAQSVAESKEYFDKAALSEDDAPAESGLQALSNRMPALAGALGEVAGVIAGEPVKVGAVVFTQDTALFGGNCESEAEMLDVLQNTIDVMRQSLGGASMGQTRH